jgi:hypothetical protein
LLVGIIGILLMSAVAKLFSWYKKNADKNAKIVSTSNSQADAVPSF